MCTCGSNAVDIFNAISGRWSTALLSTSRCCLAATSLPAQGLAIFAGGVIGCCGDVDSNAVDIFDARSGRWSTATLSVGRRFLAATSLPDQGLAIFAGGYTCLFFLLMVDGVARCMCCYGRKEGGGMCRIEGCALLSHRC